VERVVGAFARSVSHKNWRCEGVDARKLAQTAKNVHPLIWFAARALSERIACENKTAHGQLHYLHKNIAGFVQIALVIARRSC
jgi:hypothetical protein